MSINFVENTVFCRRVEAITQQLPAVDPTEPAPRLGPAGEPCTICRSPLDPAQRYCLTCGTRRPTARVEFLDVLTESSPLPPVAGPGGPAGPGYGGYGAYGAPGGSGGGLNGWLKDHGGLLGLGGIVLGTLIVGLLIGHWAGGTDTSTTAAQTPQVIRVDGGAAAGAAEGAAIADETTAADAKAADKKKADAAADKKAAAATVDPTKKENFTKDAVDDVLDDSSGNENLAPKDDDPNGANFDAIPAG